MSHESMLNYCELKAGGCEYSPIESLIYIIFPASLYVMAADIETFRTGVFLLQCVSVRGVSSTLNTCRVIA